MVSSSSTDWSRPCVTSCITAYTELATSATSCVATYAEIQTSANARRSTYSASLGVRSARSAPGQKQEPL
ncbi:hypothetical protein TrLO_g3896 [Triparma laevis f. longispina]|uniref:Uncharacterized protein n=1 Tax=Triparma laevis f. longispina TaxID=1714387 RepID=A0A9W7ALA7_9STRA|nr:hypothetical protein TrLO_g3896 [Triparma laevis f. longispina]